MFRDGTEWIIHALRGPKEEKSSIAVTRFLPDGSLRHFFATDWLPKGTVPIGRIGQVYGVAELTTPGLMAVSLGWNDGASHNAIVIASRTKNDTYVTQRIIELPGVAAIIGGPSDTIVAATSDATRAATPLLTVFDSRGRILRELLPALPGFDKVACFRNSRRAFIQRVGDSDFAVYDDIQGAVHFIRLQMSADLRRFNAADAPFWVKTAGSAPFTTRLVDSWVLFVGSPETPLSQRNVVDVHARPSGDATVTRVGVDLAGHPSTVITVYRHGGGAQIWTSPTPWQAARREPGKPGITGIIVRDSVELESLELEEEQ